MVIEWYVIHHRMRKSTFWSQEQRMSSNDDCKTIIIATVVAIIEYIFGKQGRVKMRWKRNVALINEYAIVWLPDLLKPTFSKNILSPSRITLQLEISISGRRIIMERNFRYTDKSTVISFVSRVYENVNVCFCNSTMRNKGTWKLLRIRNIWW